MKDLINKCLEESSQKDLDRYQFFIDELDNKRDNFMEILSLMRELDGTESKIMEVLFNYKLRDM